MESLLETHDLVKTFKGFVAVDGVSLCVRRGEIHALIGLVGSWVSVMIGAIFVVCVLTFRRGLVGEIERRLARRGI